MTIELLNMDNMLYETDMRFRFIYMDCIYNRKDLNYINKYWNLLDKNSVLVIQTDHSTAAQIKLYLDSMPNAYFINEIIYKQEWGGTPKKGFPKKHDNIYIYSNDGNGEGYQWFPEKVQIAKKTAGTKFDKKGTGLKTPCSVWDDLGNFSTMSKERIKNEDGKNIHWQKQLSFMRRMMSPFLKNGDNVCDPFLGSGTTGIMAIELNCNFVGIEYDISVFNLAKKRIDGIMNVTKEK
jgi:site-specific DNA-methyltransferase (adenine-specific)